MSLQAPWLEFGLCLENKLRIIVEFTLEKADVDVMSAVVAKTASTARWWAPVRPPGTAGWGSQELLGPPRGVSNEEHRRGKRWREMVLIWLLTDQSFCPKPRVPHYEKHCTRERRLWKKKEQGSGGKGHGVGAKGAVATGRHGQEGAGELHWVGRPLEDSICTGQALPLGGAVRQQVQEVALPPSAESLLYPWNLSSCGTCLDQLPHTAPTWTSRCCPLSSCPLPPFFSLFLIYYAGC